MPTGKSFRKNGLSIKRLFLKKLKAYGRSPRSKIIQGTSEDLPDRTSFKGLRKIFEINDQRLLEDFGDRTSSEDL